MTLIKPEENEVFSKLRLAQNSEFFIRLERTILSKFPKALCKKRGNQAREHNKKCSKVFEIKIRKMASPNKT